MTSQDLVNPRLAGEPRPISAAPPTAAAVEADYFAHPFIDVDEWREQPTRRYVHGGFRGTDTRFSLHLPPAGTYGGRFFQYISPVPDSEHHSEGAHGPEDRIGFALSSGAAFLETNGGGPRAADPFSGLDPDIGAFLANAAAARFARTVTERMYGPHRTYGYAFGGSGGAFRTVGAAENTSGVWDGFVPYVLGSPMAIPNCFTARMHALRLLRGVWDTVVDAVAPGGSGEPFRDLDAEQSDALREVTAMGFPIRSWFGHATMGMHGLAALYPGLRAADPTFFDDYWTVPAYLGADPDASVHRDRVQHTTRIKALLDVAAFEADGHTAVQHAGTSTGSADDAWLGSGMTGLPVAVRLDSVPGRDPQASELIVQDGPAAGARLVVLSLDGDLAVLGPNDPLVLEKLRPGIGVELDNSGFLAMQTYHRHQVPGHDYPVWDQFRDSQGRPRYPQRPMLIGPIFAAATAGSVQSGRYEGRMIVVECLLDREAYAWQADWYRQRVLEHLGAATDDRFRLWLVDNALHGDFEQQEHPRSSVSYLGVLQRALRDLAAWVENGREPAATSAYTVVDGQLVLPNEVPERGGVQPAVGLTVNGRDRIAVSTGESVLLRSVVTLPGAEPLTSLTIEWDDGDGRGFQSDGQPQFVGAGVMAERTLSYATPGTYLPAVRITAVRADAGDAGRFARVQNLAGARVVVR